MNNATRIETIDRMEKYIHNAMDLLDFAERASTRQDFKYILERIPELLEEDEAIGDIVGDMEDIDRDFFDELVDQISPLFGELKELQDMVAEQLDVLNRTAAPAAGGKRKNRKSSKSSKSRKSRKSRKTRKGKGRTRRV